jgi:transposase
MEWRMTGVLTDEQWAVLEPMIEVCRPHRKTQHHDLRQTIEAIIWRCQNGAKWRSLPAEFGPRSGLLT